MSESHTKMFLAQKTEHHDGCLFDLEELAMPHQHICAISLLGHVCPSLRLLSLQANRIQRLESLSRLKVRFQRVAVVVEGFGLGPLPTQLHAMI